MHRPDDFTSQIVIMIKHFYGHDMTLDYFAVGNLFLKKVLKIVLKAYVALLIKELLNGEFFK